MPLNENRLQLEHVGLTILLRNREARLLAHQLVVLELVSEVRDVPLLTSCEYFVSGISASMRESSAFFASRFARLLDSLASRSARFARPASMRCCLSVLPRSARAA